jgi:hypothetical protein
MAQTTADLHVQVNTQLPTNHQRLVQAGQLRTVAHNIVDHFDDFPIPAARLSATGTKDASTYLAGDNTWKTIFGGGATSGGVSSANFVATLALAKTTSFPTVGSGGPSWVITQGFAAINDNGGALYERISSLPAAPLANVGTWQSADGSYWIMRLSGSEVHVMAFGATRMAGDSDFSVDSLQAFRDCRDWILAYAVGAANNTGITMVFDGYYYCSKSIDTGGGNYNIRGQTRDSRITTPWPYDQIIVQAGSSFGREGWVYSSAFPIFLGQRASVGNHIYVAVTPGTPSGSTPPSGTGIGQIDGSVIWNYEREKTYAEQQTGGFTGKISNLTVASNWSSGGTPHATGIEAIHPSDDQTNLATEGAFFSGIVVRNRCNIEEVACFGQPGMGLCYAGSGDPFVRGPANVDDWRASHITAGFLGWNGIHIGQFNANAGVGTDFDLSHCGAIGLANLCFLDNKFFGVQHDGDGQWLRGYSKYPTSVAHRGLQWMSRLPILGIENPPLYVNEEPGAAPVSTRIPWLRWDGDGTFQFATLTASRSGTTLNVTAAAGSTLNIGTFVYDGGVTSGTMITGFGSGSGGVGTYTVNTTQTLGSVTMHADTVGDANFAPWDPAQRYMPGGAYGSNNSNDFSVIFGEYHESGTWPAQYGIRNIVIGSALTAYDTSRGATVLDKGQWQGPVRSGSRYTSDTGRKFRQVQFGATPLDGQNGTLADSAVWNFIDYDGTLYEFGSAAEFETATRGDRTLHNDFDFGEPSGSKWFRLSGKNTLRDYGRGVPLPYALQIPNLILGDTLRGGKRVFGVTGIPSGGPFAVGDLAINQSGAVGQPKAWICTAAPTLLTSTWTSWGNL